jgi:hypothetical protein
VTQKLQTRDTHGRRCKMDRLSFWITNVGYVCCDFIGCTGAVAVRSEGAFSIPSVPCACGGRLWTSHSFRGVSPHHDKLELKASPFRTASCVCYLQACSMVPEAALWPRPLRCRRHQSILLGLYRMLSAAKRLCANGYIDSIYIIWFSFNL